MYPRDTPAGTLSVAGMILVICVVALSHKGAVFNIIGIRFLIATKTAAPRAQYPSKLPHPLPVPLVALPAQPPLVFGPWRRLRVALPRACPRRRHVHGLGCVSVSACLSGVSVTGLALRACKRRILAADAHP